ncbi:MAG: hypothetical protein IPN97_08365 [Saprospiraceae bacterium]|nr:hypothetical protein [Saprospiraceae bacterium]
MESGVKSITYNFRVWSPQSAFIKWVIENRTFLKSMNLDLGFHMNLVGSLCSILESVCECILIENLTSNQHIPAELDKIKMRNDVNRAQWKNFDSLFAKVFSNNISFYANNVQNIDYLFKLRNSVLHGNKLELVYSIDHKKEANFQIKGGKYKEVYDFLKHNQILKDDINSLDSNPSVLFSDLVIDYFLNETIIFVRSLSNSILTSSFDKNMIDTNIIEVLASK